MIQNRLGLKTNKQNGVVKQRLGRNLATGSVSKKEVPVGGGDARFRLIQKKRLAISDARDAIVKKGRKVDARVRLNSRKPKNAAGKARTTSNSGTKNVRNIAANGPNFAANGPNFASNGLNFAADGPNFAANVPNFAGTVPNFAVNGPTPLMNMALNTPNQNNFVRSPNVQRSFPQHVQTTTRRSAPVRKSVQQNMGVQSKAHINQNGSLVRTVKGEGNAPTKAFKTVQKSTFVTKKAAVPTRPSRNTIQKKGAERYHPIPKNPNVVTIRNDRARPARPTNTGPYRPTNTGPYQQTGPYRSQPAPTQMKPKRPAVHTSPFANQPYSGRRGNNPNHPNAGMAQQNQQYGGNVWDSQPQRPSMASDYVNPTRLQITTENNFMNGEQRPMRRQQPQSRSQKPSSWQQYQQMREPPRPNRQSYDDVDADSMAPAPPPSRGDNSQPQSNLSNGMRQRLDDQHNRCYKAIVTNLHPIVTVKDVEELFGNVGPILAAKLISDGVAEVVFVNKKDCLTSVSIYNNRQLDGRAMSVTVVPPQAVSPPLYSAPTPSPSRYNQTSPRSDHFPATPQPRGPMRRGNDMAFPRNMGASASAGFMGRQMSASGGNTKSVLRTAEGGSYHPYATTNFAASRRPSHMGGGVGGISPSVSAIHSALFNSRDALGSRGGHSNPPVYIKMPKNPPSHMRSFK